MLVPPLQRPDAGWCLSTMAEGLQRATVQVEESRGGVWIGR